VTRKAEPDFDTLLSLDSPHLVKYFDFYNNGTKDCLVMEYLGGGDLTDLAKTPLDEEKTRIIIE